VNAVSHIQHSVMSAGSTKLAHNIPQVSLDISVSHFGYLVLQTISNVATATTCIAFPSVLAGVAVNSALSCENPRQQTLSVAQNSLDTCHVYSCGASRKRSQKEPEGLAQAFNRNKPFDREIVRCQTSYQ
jgi:hypothetical protein